MPIRRRTTAVVLAVLVAMLIGVPGIAAAATGASRATLSVLFGAAVSAASTPIPSGADGRLTVLLLGSDQRPGVSGERLDVIMVMTLRDGTLAAGSIPRDTMKFPRAPANRSGSFGSTSGTQRVNEMYARYKPICAGSAAEKRRCAANRFMKDVAHALDVEIDGWAYIKFDAFDLLVDHIGGVTVTPPAKIVDRSYMDEPTLPKGVWFRPAPTVMLGRLTPNCLSWDSSVDPACERAIVYVRSRKGKEGTKNNNDFRRTLRQQGLVAAALRQVGGWDEAGLDGLVDAVANRMAVGDFDTSLPTDLGSALWLAGQVSSSTLVKSTALGPSKFATVSGSKLVLKLAAVRAWADANLSTQPD